MRVVVVLLFTLALSPLVNATIIRVPQDQLKVQHAIWAASSGDTVLVSPGTYNENLAIEAGVTLKSIGGPSTTTLRSITNGQSVINVYVDSDSTPVEISGFTLSGTRNTAGISIVAPKCRLTNDWVTDNSGGTTISMICNSSAEVLGCKIWGNSGGECSGIWIQAAAYTTIQGNTIHSNSNGRCGGIRIDFGLSATIQRNLIYKVSNNHPSYGVALHVASIPFDRVFVENNTIVDNTGGLSNVAVWCRGQFNDNIVANNKQCFGVGTPGSLVSRYNDYWNNQLGNAYNFNPSTSDISLNPRFFDPTVDDYRVVSSSPCVDAGTPSVLDDDGTRVDIGAFSYWHPRLALLGPIDDTVLTTAFPKFSWSNLAPQLIINPTYTLIYDTLSDFSTANSETDIVDTIYSSTSEFVRGRLWYWKVKAISSTGIEVNSTSSGTFFVDTPPGTAEIVSPDDSSEVTPESWLLWSASLDPDPFDTVSYLFRVDINIDFGNPILQWLLTPDTLASLSNGFLDREDFVGIRVSDVMVRFEALDDTKYYWNVEAVDRFKLTSLMQDQPQRFVLNLENDPPAAVQSTVHPPNHGSENDLLPTIVWLPATDPDMSDGPSTLHYNVQLDTDAEFDSDVMLAYITQVGSYSISIPDSLIDETLWSYRIQTVDESGLVSPWSPNFSFWTNSRNDPPRSFELAYPTFGQVALEVSPSFSWSLAIDSDPLDSVTYRIELAADSNFESIIASTTSSLNGLAPGSIEKLERAKYYWWRVFALDHADAATQCNSNSRFRTFISGDADSNQIIHIGDAVTIIKYIFGIANPVPVESCNADCSARIDISDAVYIINYIFAHGPSPCSQ